MLTLTLRYHCHTDACYPDGYRQALIVHDNNSYFANDYDEAFTVTLSDWYHELQEDITPEFLSLYNPSGAEPIPDSFLFNDTLGTSLAVQPNTTYLIRLLNIGAFVAQYFYIEDHTFQIVEIDGVYTEPTEASILYIAVAQRYTILLTTKDTANENYAVVTMADSTLLDTIPSDLVLNNTNWLQYNTSAAYPQANITVSVSSDLNPFDDSTLVPYDHMPLLENPSQSINLAVVMQDLINGFDYAFLNNISYTAPKVPTLYSVLSAGDLATDAAVYGEYTHSIVLDHNDVVEIILNNNDTGSHPFHLHGHQFQVLTRYPAYGANFFEFADAPDPLPYNASNSTAFPMYPARRDTLVLPPQGYFVIRFVADNPGVWLFHCHIDYHLSQGLALSFVEAPQQMQERLTIPSDHLAVCGAAGVQTEGNAAGNTEDYTDLTGQNTQQGWIPDGFTARGIVAMVFTVLSAFLGMGSIVLYGLSDLKFVGGNVQTTQEVVEEYHD